MKIFKRNGSLAEFDPNKIMAAIEKAMSETSKGVDNDLSSEIAERIEDDITGSVILSTVECIQDLVEDYLMDSERKDVAKRYILYRAERTKIRKEGWQMTDLQKDIYEKKYRYKNESFEEFLERVSGGNSSIKKLMADKKFLPAGRILAGRGLNEKGHKVCYSNCFVITPPEDNLESIFETSARMARTFSYGGGCGTDLGLLRPLGAKVNNAALSTTGAISFADLYSTTAGLIGMKNRRGALMLSMPVTHPDIIEFINMKTDLDRVTKANISVKVTDDFMDAAKRNKKWNMKFEVEDTGETIRREDNAKDMLNLLAKNNWNVAEPGMLYWDRITGWHLNSENPDFEYVSVNPCAEKALTKEGSCLLSSFNLSEYVVNPFTAAARFDTKTFIEDVKDVVVYMNEVLEEGLEFLPLEEQKEAALDYRQLGIGVMGLADMFIKMGLEYGGEGSKDVVRDVFGAMANAAMQQSALLAKEHGPYRLCNKEALLDSPYLQAVGTNYTKSLIEKYGLRNAELLSIAPTGSISTMLGVSGGAEPIFQNSYTRKSESLGEDGDDIYYTVYTQIVKEYMEANNIHDEDSLPYYFVTAMDLDYRNRIELQGELQHYVDSAISSTVNLPETATVEDVVDLYTYAWEQGLKGITVYRDNCQRSGILISNETMSKSSHDKISELQSELDNAILESLKEDPNKCPMCGGEMFHSGGCTECRDCGYSPCAI